MPSIDINAIITKPVDELENDIFFSLNKEQLQDFICSLDEKSGSVDFTLQLIRKLVSGWTDYYKCYITSMNDDDEYYDRYEERYTKLGAILNILDDIR